VLSRSKPCPCTSGKTYGSCCHPFHKGEADPQDGPTLVRARYSAFALGEIDFLWKTLHPHHPDREKGKDAVLAALRVASGAFRYMGLTMLDARSMPAGDPNGVALALYVARIFQKGRDVSFVELAQFAFDEGGIRYLAGRSLDVKEIAGDVAKLTIDTFPPPT
jgi:SEC-C motif-containing protein